MSARQLVKPARQAIEVSHRPFRIPVRAPAVPSGWAKVRAVSTSSGVDATKSSRSDSHLDAPERTDSLSPKQVDTYLNSKLIPPKAWGNDPALIRSRQRAIDAGLPNIEVSPMQGQFLSVLAMAMGAVKILEIGTLWGYSTSFLAKTLPSHGQIDTLEISPQHARIAQENFIDLDLYPFPKVHIGDALSTLRNLPLPGSEEGLKDDERGYDLIFVDADKEGYFGYWLESLRLVRKGGVVVVDNAIRGGEIAREGGETRYDCKGLRKIYDWIEQDVGKSVLVSGIQTIGAKNWDGFIIAVKL